MPMSPNIDDVLSDIPIEYRDRFGELVRRPTIPADELREQVERYLGTVRQVGKMVKLLDMDQAEALAEACLALLDHVHPDGADTAKMLVQGAVSYFVIEEDDEEITGVLGFDDDAQVLNAACRALGRDDLVLPVKRPD